MKLIALILLAATITCNAVLIPPERLHSWDPGPRGGFQSPSTVFADVTNSIPGTNIVCVGDGTTDDYRALQAALTLATSNTVVKLGPGTYKLTNGLSMIKDGVTLRGAGTNLTFLKFYGPTGGDGISIGLNNGTTGDVDWTAGFGKGTNVLTVSSTNGLFVGATIAYATTNNVANGSDYNTWPLMAVANTNNSSGVDSYLGYKSGRYSLASLATITAITSNTITVDPPLDVPYTNGQNLIFKFGTFNQRIGLENFTIIDAATNQYAANHISAYQCVNLQISNVWSLDVSATHMRLTKCLHSQIIDCTLDGALSFTANAGYGCEFYFYTTACAFQNNIVQRCLNVHQSVASGQNVIAYNFSTNCVGPNDSRRMTFGDAGNHGAYNHMNLYEGNEGDSSFSDAIHGTSGWLVFLRDRYRGWGTNNTSGSPTGMVYAVKGIELAFGMRFCSIVGCVIGTTNIDPGIAWRSFSYEQTNTFNDFQSPTIYKLGCFNSAVNSPIVDTNVAFTLIRANNLISYTNGPFQILSKEADANPVPTSYYLASKPAWFSTWPYPAIGSDLADATGTIPAKARYYGLSAPEGGGGGGGGGGSGSSTNSTFVFFPVPPLPYSYYTNLMAKALVEY